MRTIARLFSAVTFLTITHMSCTNAPDKTNNPAAVTKQDFGQAYGKPVYLYTLTNKKGVLD